MAIIDLDSNNFKDFISNGKVLVDFNADWCGPCRMLAPVLERVSEKKEEVKFASLNIDENESIASKYNIYSIPCLIMFDNGKEIKRKVGFMNEDEVGAFIDG